MTNDGLLAQWERIRGHLARAWVELPPGLGDLSLYQEFLDHSELELAMEALADVGLERTATEGFWHALSDAAREMDLPKRVREYEDRAEVS